MVHDPGRGAIGRGGQAAADDLAQGRQVGRDSVPSLGTAVGDPEAGHDLVEDEHRAVLLGQLAEGLEVAGPGRDQAHVAGDRLEQDRGDLPAVMVEEVGDSRGIVERAEQGILCGTRGHSRAVGRAERRGGRARLDEQGVDVAVIVAGHLDDLVAARDAARDPDGRHGRLGAGRDEPDLLDRRHGRGHGLGDLDLAHRRGAEARAQVQRLDDRRADPRMSMAQDHRPPRADVIDVLVTVDVVEVGPFGSGHERRLAADRAERPRRAVHPAGNHAVGAEEGVVALGKREVGSKWRES